MERLILPITMVVFGSGRSALYMIRHNLRKQGVLMKNCILVLVLASLVSCASTITRWPDKSQEKGSRTETIVRKSNIFQDYLWTTPNIKSVRVDNSFTYNDHHYTFTEQNNQVQINDGNISQQATLKKSDKVYSDISKLKSTTIYKQRWVPKTRFVHETVPVHKTRTVPQTTFDTKGKAHTSFKTEFYTDWEMRVVPKTDWEWEQYSERSYVIPESQFFDISMSNGDHFFIYRNDNNDAVTYYLQNPEYYVVKEEKNSLFGVDDTNILFVDAQSNGIFFEPNDLLLINIWNPYDKNSKHRSISNIMDNYWYTSSFINNNYFLDLKVSSGSISFIYENKEYINSKGTGKITINNINIPKKSVFLNGKKYPVSSGKSSSIQFGKYHLTIRVPNHLDYDDYFVVDEKNNSVTIDYKETQIGSPVKFKNIFSDDYKVIFTLNNEEKILYSPKEVLLPVGKQTIIIDINGFKLSKELDITEGQTIDFDFEKEVSSLN